jgi:hypothetical protein
MVPTDLRCRIAESPDGTIKTQSAQEQLGKDLDTTVSIEPPTRTLELSLNTLSHKWAKSAMDLMVPKCKTAECPDGTTRTQSARERLEKDQATTALTELPTRMLVPLLRSQVSFRLQKVVFTTSPLALTETPLIASQPALNLLPEGAPKPPPPTGPRETDSRENTLTSEREMKNNYLSEVKLAIETYVKS